MNDRYIYHITSRQEWELACQKGYYEPGHYDAEGFIHCSTASQVSPVANRFYRGQVGLVLLQIDSLRLKPILRYENLEGGDELFPHLYGLLELDAVSEVINFPPCKDGSFEFPKAHSHQG